MKCYRNKTKQARGETTGMVVDVDLIANKQPGGHAGARMPRSGGLLTVDNSS